MMRAVFIAVLAVLLAGCHGSAPRPHARYYQSWENIPGELCEQLDSARLAADEHHESVEPLLRYARLSTKLARVAAGSWLKAAGSASDTSGAKTRNTRVDRSRIRLLESCNNSLALYNELRLSGMQLPWQDRVSVAWLLVLSGLDEEAREIIDGTLTDPNIPDETRGDLIDLRGRLEKLPPQEAR